MQRAIVAGVALAAIAAVAFGATTPIVAWAAAGPLVTAALLYFGAGATALVVRRRMLVNRRLLVIALAGAVVAPAALVWGLGRVGATVGSLVLNLEAVFTVVLARLVYREPIGARVAAAVAVMTAGGALLALGAWRAGSTSALGLAAIALATLAWATDNTLTRPLAERDPLDVVAGKGLLGAACTGVLALLAGESLPRWDHALVLLVCGATGYGASLRLYMLAQRRMGAGRTGSVFALAPFVGAALAYALGDRGAGGWTVAAAVLFVAGVALHITEHHHHRHTHHAIDHDHVHRHDDGHHTHVHDPPVAGEHSHPHHHDELVHDHDHAPDLHHDHGH